MSIRLLITLGPSSLNEEVITQCDQFGVFVFRINLSHTPLDKVKETIDTIRCYTKTPICLDSEGAQIRNQIMQNGESYLEKGKEVLIHFEEVLGDANNLSFTPKGIAREFQIGDVIDIDFHSVSLQVMEVNRENYIATVLESGKVGSCKATEVGREMQLPAITPKDEQAIEIGKEMGIQHFALSFANSQKDVDLFRSKVGKDSYVISKVESRSGVSNLVSISEKSDAILIDRGDLSRQIPVNKIPFLQRRIISIVRTQNKPVFVATNLLESMVINKMPTRAEVNDVVSTLEMGANGLVLAAETAIGSYPAECVEMLRSLAEQFERWTPNTSIEELLFN